MPYDDLYMVLNKHGTPVDFLEAHTHMDIEIRRLLTAKARAGSLPDWREAANETDDLEAKWEADHHNLQIYLSEYERLHEEKYGIEWAVSAPEPIYKE